MFDVEKIRANFPILQSRMHGHPLVYLDNGATTQKPQTVIDAGSRYYASDNANIHRGVYHLSQQATALYEESRRKIARFINAGEDREIIFTRGTTEGINLVAAGYTTLLEPGDEVLITAMEHHSNIVPWQIACQRSGATLRHVPITDAGELQLDQLPKLLTGKTRIFAVTHLSNSLGTINDVKKFAAAAHSVGAKILVDGAQWIAHQPTDVRDLDADFYVFSGHKLFGPTGIGVLYGKAAALEALPPYQSGGDMIESVTLERTTYAGLPNKFEAGTPNIAGAIGLGAAVDFVLSVGFENILPHEWDLFQYASKQLADIPGLRIVGTAEHRASVISFVIEKPVISSYDIGLALDRRGIAVRTGHHCCQPVMDRMGIASTARASLAMYNTRQEIDALAAALREMTTAKPSQAVPSAVTQEVVYPSAFGASPQEAAEVLAGDFELLGDAQMRNQYVLDLGEQLPHLFELLKKATDRIPGCMSQVYLVARRSIANPAVLEFVADADAAIVRGLIAILQRLFSGQEASAIVAFDIEAFFHRIGLDQFLSAQRRNGLAGMVAKLRREAAAIIQNP